MGRRKRQETFHQPTCIKWKQYQKNISYKYHCNHDHHCHQEQQQQDEEAAASQFLTFHHPELKPFYSYHTFNHIVSEQ
jgi:hypothetical protein